MFKQILTPLRGRAIDAAHRFLSQDVIPMLGQQIRGPSAAIRDNTHADELIRKVETATTEKLLFKLNRNDVA